MVDNFIVIQLLFAEKFESQDFTIRAAPGLSGPANTCAMGTGLICVRDWLDPLADWLHLSLDCLHMCVD